MSMFYNEQTNEYKGVNIAVVTTAVFSTIVAGFMFGLPVYNVWSAEMSGKAKLSESEYSKKVKIEEAKSNLEAQKLNAKAEVERAKGAAQAIAIESGKLTENYIRYLWVQQQDNLNDKTVVYIPTEAGLPLLEANRNRQGE